MNNDMPNTVKNRRKCVQFIAQEAKRFNLLPFSRDACAEIVDEFRRKSDRKDKLVTKFRPMISIIKTASVLANNEGLNVVERKHVVEARETHCKPIGLQLLEKHVDRISEYRIIDPNAKPQKGQIYGLVVYSDQWVEGEAGGVIPIKASVTPTIKGKESLTVTGVNMDAGSWAQNSRLKVLTVIHQLYPKTQTKAYNMHIDFAQFNEVDGPSAGVAMALVLVSLFENKSLRQDTAVTGEINIGVDGKVTITPIGGVYEKIAAAEKCGFKRILIPTKNYELNVNSKDFKIEIIPCETLDDYKKNILVDD
jgi:lon-related putative ATP-dependent protease